MAIELPLLAQFGLQFHNIRLANLLLGTAKADISLGKMAMSASGNSGHENEPSSSFCRRQVVTFGDFAFTSVDEPVATLE